MVLGWIMMTLLNGLKEGVELMTIKVRYSTDEVTVIPQENGDWIDLATVEEVSLKAGEYRNISLGVSMELPAGYEAHVIPRSSTFKKFGILQANSFGLIDNTYCGNDDIWHFPAYATRDVVIPKGVRICQFRVQKCMPKLEIKVVDNLENDNRGGFGSSGW